MPATDKANTIINVKQIALIRINILGRGNSPRNLPKVYSGLYVNGTQVLTHEEGFWAAPQSTSDIATKLAESLGLPASIVSIINYPHAKEKTPLFDWAAIEKDLKDSGELYSPDISNNSGGDTEKEDLYYIFSPKSGFYDCAACQWVIHTEEATLLSRGDHDFYAQKPHHLPATENKDAAVVAIQSVASLFLEELIKEIVDLVLESTENGDCVVAFINSLEPKNQYIYDGSGLYSVKNCRVREDTLNAVIGNLLANLSPDKIADIYNDSQPDQTATVSTSGDIFFVYTTPEN